MLMGDRRVMDASSEIAMPLNSNASVDGRAVTAECAEPRRGLKRSRNSCVLRGDKSLDFQTVPVLTSRSHNPGSRPPPQDRRHERL